MGKKKAQQAVPFEKLHFESYFFFFAFFLGLAALAAAAAAFPAAASWDFRLLIALSLALSAAESFLLSLVRSLTFFCSDFSFAEGPAFFFAAGLFLAAAFFFTAGDFFLAAGLFLAAAFFFTAGDFFLAAGRFLAAAFFFTAGLLALDFDFGFADFFAVAIIHSPHVYIRTSL